MDPRAFWGKGGRPFFDTFHRRERCVPATHRGAGRLPTSGRLEGGPVQYLTDSIGGPGATGVDRSAARGASHTWVRPYDVTDITDRLPSRLR